MTVTCDWVFYFLGEQGSRLLKTECLIAGYYNQFFILKNTCISCKKVLSFYRLLIISKIARGTTKISQFPVVRFACILASIASEV